MSFKNGRFVRETTALPSSAALFAAFTTIHHWEDHYYELLYSQEPPLANIDTRARAPFKVELTLDKYSRHSLRIIHTKNPDYSFHVPLHEGEGSDFDAIVLERCRLIMDAVARGLEKPKFYSHHYCCPLAVPEFCVCEIKLRCPIHGTACHGSHD